MLHTQWRVDMCLLVDDIKSGENDRIRT